MLCCRFREIAAFAVPRVEPPPYDSARRPCGYCGARLGDRAYREHLVSAHSDSLFHCDECDTYVDRKDFIIHMSLHAVEYTDKPDKKEQIKKIKNIRKKIKRKAASVNNENRIPKIQDAKVNDVRKSMERPSDPQKNEFSDHSDTEFGFGPLPNSVFEAIEDSQGSQSNSKIFNPLENSQDSQPDLNIFKELEETINCQPNDIEPMEVTSTQEEHKNEQELPKKTDTTNQSPELEKGPPEPPKPTNKNSHKRSRTCPICGKIYTASSSYFYHMKHFHKRSKDHECDICGKRFGTKACLMQHKPIHTGECRYECKKCSKKFRSKASLYIHEQTHNGVKTWACSQCQLSFRWRTHLVRHMKRHSAEKAHVCGTCGRGFSIRCDLLRHARTHAAGEFACEKCGVKFAQLRYLKVHMDRKHSAIVDAKNNVTIVGDKENSIVVAEKEPSAIVVENAVPMPSDL